MHIITKEFDWAMGHRVHNQSLDAALSCNSGCKCKMLHGHSYKAIVGLESDFLEDDMVMDFTDLKFIKAWIDTNWDHRFMLDLKDPLLSHITQGHEILPAGATCGAEILIPEDVTSEERTILESFVLVGYVPTSERIAADLANMVEQKLPEGVRLSYVTIKESPTSSATYRP